MRSKTFGYFGIFVCIIMSFCIGFTTKAYFADGTFDSTFDATIGPNGQVRGLIQQSDLKIVVGGPFTTYNGITANRIVRLDMNGSVDSTFNLGGSGFNNTVLFLLQQPDGKILVGGDFTTYNGLTRNRLIRLNTNGTIDTTFNSGGVGPNSSIQTIALQSDGKILIGGDFTTYNGVARNRVARLTSTGTLDTTFVPGVGPNLTVYALAANGSGKIFVGGTFSTYNGSGNYRALAVLHTGGALDTSFTGRVNNNVQKLLLQPDGKMLIFGSFTTYSSGVVNRIVRLNPDNTVDTTFSSASSPYDAVIRNATLQSDDSIIVGGLFSQGRIRRATTTGLYDTTFNSGGAGLAGGGTARVYDLFVQPDGKYVVGGNFLTYNGNAVKNIARIGYGTTITIQAPTKILNVPITDTTIVITGNASIYATGVSISPSSTATASNLVCIQISDTRIECTVQVDTSGTLVISAINANGAVQNKSETNYIVDYIVPSVPNISIDTQTPYSVNSPLVSFGATDNIAIDYCEVEYRGDDFSSGSVSGSVISVSPATSPMIVNLDPDEVLHTVLVRCYDTAGNFSENLVKFPPIVSYTIPTQISNVSIENATVTMTSPQGNDLDNIIVISTITPTPTVTNCIGSGSDMTVPYASPVTCEIHGIVQSGTVRISVRDIGTAAIGENAASFIIDTIAPVGTISAPTLVSNTGIMNTTITITDDTLLSGNLVVLSGATTATVSNFICTQVNGVLVTCTMQIDDDGDVVVQVQDVAGNIITLSQTGYIVDTIFPAISTIDDISISVNTGDRYVLYVTDDIQLQTGSLLYGFSMDAICDATDSYTISYESGTGVLITDDSHNGEYICSQATDHVGNTTYMRSTNMLNIDTTAPTISVTPWTGYHTVGNLVITGTGEVGAVITVYNASGVALCSTTINTGGTYSCGPLGLGNGVHNVSIVGVDGLGNTTTPIAMSVSIDTTAPVITLIGNGEIRVPLGGEYVESGANGMDNIDGDISGNIVISGSVNTGVAGSYEITYNVIDGAGNVAITVIRTVVVYNPAVTGYAGGGGTSNGSTSTNTTPTNTNNEGTTNTNNQGNTVEPGVPLTAITTLYNGGIEEGKCYVRGTGTTVYQGNGVSMDFRKAHQMLYSYGLTKWKGTLEYRPEDGITREEAARFMVEYAKNVLCREKTNEYSNTFSDIGKADGSLQKYIKESYEYGIFKGVKGEFKPKNIITEDEIAAVIVRLVTGKMKEEQGDTWAVLYKTELGNYMKKTTITDINKGYRGDIAEVMYDVYRNNEYEWTAFGYVIK